MPKDSIGDGLIGGPANLIVEESVKSWNASGIGSRVAIHDGRRLREVCDVRRGLLVNDTVRYI